MEVNLRKPQPRNGKATLLREEKAVKSEGRPLLSLRLSKSGIPDDAVHTPDSPYGFQKHLHLPKQTATVKAPLPRSCPSELEACGGRHGRRGFCGCCLNSHVLMTYLYRPYPPNA